MAESKKYWYIQLNVNFFEDERIDWLCEQKNGYEYVVLYLKLCLKTANNNGILTRQIGDMIIPYNVDKIADITHMNVDVVRVAFELYKKIGLVYEADSECNFMRLPEVPAMVGCVTQAALDKRKQRERKQLEIGQRMDNVQDNVQDNLPDNVQDNVQDNLPDNVKDNVPQELRDKSLELIYNNLEKEKKKKEKRTRFSPPSVDEVRAYCLERGNTIDPEAFVAFYASKGWKIGSQPMKSWKAAVITWEKRMEQSAPKEEKKRRFVGTEIVDGEEVAIYE